MSTFDLTPNVSSETPKTTISDAVVFEIIVICVYSLIFGLISKVDIQFYSNFNKEQNPHSLGWIFFLQIQNFGVYCH